MMSYNQYGLERIGREHYHVQYRINKRGAECFRTGDHIECLNRFRELSEKKPGVYTMQCRSVRVDKYGYEFPQPLEKTIWIDS